MLNLNFQNGTTPALNARNMNAIVESINTLGYAVGGPNVASTVSAMTDTSKVYVYTGSETGYTAGNWYYYNGSAWVSGGVYQATAVETDTTLTMPGEPADAKATGDAVTELKSAFTQLNEFCRAEIETKFKNSYHCTAGTGLSASIHALNVSIPNGTTYKIKVSDSDGVIGNGKFVLYANGVSIGTNNTNQEYTYTASADITYFSLYQDSTRIVNTGNLLIEANYEQATQNSLEERINNLETRSYPTTNISVISGIAISGETGKIIQNYENYVASNNIPIWGCAGKEITFNVCLYGSVGFAIYDKDGEYLYGFSGGTASAHGYENKAVTQTVTITLPERTCFIRTTIRKEYYTTVVDFGITVDFVNPIPTYNTFVDARLLEDVKAPHDYYFANDYLPNKCAAINNALDLYAADGDAFMFFTDQHWFQNAKQSPCLIRYIEKNCNIYRLFCGGDSFDHGNVDFVKDVNDAFHGRIHYVMGNHEYFYPTTGAQLYRMYDMDHPNQIGENSRHYYYVDNHQSRIRYIILSAYDNGTSSSTIVTSGYEPDQITWLNETLSNSPYDVLVFTHDMDTIHSLNLPVINALDTYKSGGGTVIGIICGHKHWDELEFTTGGIPIISVQCDKNEPWIAGGVDQEPFLEDRATGTIREQVVDTFVIDRTNRKIHQIRTGCPIRYGTDPSEWTELESTEISY